MHSSAVSSRHTPFAFSEAPRHYQLTGVLKPICHLASSLPPTHPPLAADTHFARPGYLLLFLDPVGFQNGEQTPPHTYLGFQKRQRLISLQAIDKDEVLCCRMKTFLMFVLLGKR